MLLVSNSSTSITSVCSGYTTTKRAAFNDKNNQLVFNNHDHTQISEDHGVRGNDGTVLNDKTSHYNDNFNSNRGETFEENLSVIPTPNLLTLTSKSFLARSVV